MGITKNIGPEINNVSMRTGHSQGVRYCLPVRPKKLLFCALRERREFSYLIAFQEIQSQLVSEK